MVLKVTFCTGAIKSSNLCWWTWVIISVKICLASTRYKLFKHRHYALVICGILMYVLKSSASSTLFWPIVLHRAFSKCVGIPLTVWDVIFLFLLFDQYVSPCKSLLLILQDHVGHGQRTGTLIMFIEVSHTCLLCLSRWPHRSSLYGITECLNLNFTLFRISALEYPLLQGCRIPRLCCTLSVGVEGRAIAWLFLICLLKRRWQEDASVICIQKHLKWIKLHI